MSKIILITGGARSGKSSYALERAEAISSKRLFVATCPKIDSEMSERVRRHQEERDGRGWITVESEINLGAVIKERTSGIDVVLIDCITLWVNNILFAHDSDDSEVDDHFIGALCNEWLETTKRFAGTVICVTNEVGLGVVPDNSLARRYRDLVGTCNQLIGRNAGEVVLVSCGIPLFLKKSDNGL
ncbi:MAG: bifunctional adenosylcobinamide kinase/adenosylcobinamide-phosphate guanylyltransferase [Desulforhopalus sp.]